MNNDLSKKEKQQNTITLGKKILNKKCKTNRAYNKNSLDWLKSEQRKRVPEGKKKKKREKEEKMKYARVISFFLRIGMASLPNYLSPVFPAPSPLSLTPVITIEPLERNSQYVRPENVRRSCPPTRSQAVSQRERKLGRRCPFESWCVIPTEINLSRAPFKRGWMMKGRRRG